MQAKQFEQSIVSILKRDKRFDPHAFFFLKDALDFTLKRISESNAGTRLHRALEKLRKACDEDA